MKWFAALVLILSSTMVHAESSKRAPPDNPKWKKECGSCHIAYPAKLLRAIDWQRLMEGLDNHFGAQAVLSTEDNKEILDFLQRHAGFRAKNSASSLRISDTPWFTRAHRKIPSNTWSDPAVKSRANCVACHINAGSGDWSKRGIRVPKAGEKTPAHTDGVHADAGKRSLPPDNAKWKEECGSCHLAYPPRFLIAADWQKLMGELGKHFDANAELNPKDNKEILDFLIYHAAYRQKYSAPSLRISDTPWFTQLHDEIPSNTWSDPAVKNRANCVACHIKAEDGDWSEHSIHIPGGPDGEKKKSWWKKRVTTQNPT